MRTFAVLIGVLCFLFTSLPFIQTNAWWIRILDFPRLQIAILCLISLCLLIGFLNKRKFGNQVLITLVAASLLYQLSLIVQFTPLYPVEAPGNQDQVGDNEFSILQSNVLMSNRQSDALLALINKYKPDILSINEPNEWWAEQLVVLENEYPYSIKKPLPNTYGMIMYSKLPLRDTAINFLVAENVPSFFAKVVLPSGRIFNLHLVHPEPPRPGSSTYERDTELLIIGRRLHKDGEPAIVVGDLNDVAWSRTTRKFKEYGKVLDPRRGRGLYNTFNVNQPLLRYPLDHVFYTKGFKLNKLEKLSDIGSDHFPMFISLSFKPEG